MTASAVTVLPEPDSPTTATRSPGASANDTPSTARTGALVGARTRRTGRRSRAPAPRSSSAGRSCADRCARVERVAQTVADEVDREHGEEDRQPREHGEPPLVLEGRRSRRSAGCPNSAWAAGCRTPRNDSVRLDEDRFGDHEGRVHDDRPDAVREHVPHDDPRVRGADRARGVDELALTERQRGAAHHARDRPPEQAATGAA